MEILLKIISILSQFAFVFILIYVTTQNRKRIKENEKTIRVLKIIIRERNKQLYETLRKIEDVNYSGKLTDYYAEEKTKIQRAVCSEFDISLIKADKFIKKQLK